MEITNLDNPIDDELMIELRDLTRQVDGLLDRVQADRRPIVHEIELSDLRCLDTFIEAPADLLN